MISGGVLQQVFQWLKYSMDSHDVRDLRRTVLKHRRANASDNKDPSPSTSTPRIKDWAATPVSRMFSTVRYPPKSKFELSFGQQVTTRPARYGPKSTNAWPSNQLFWYGEGSSLGLHAITSLLRLTFLLFMWAFLAIGLLSQLFHGIDQSYRGKGC